MASPSEPTPRTEAGRAHQKQSVNGCVLCEKPWDAHTPLEQTGAAERTWAKRRSEVAERWSRVADTFGAPASAFEVAGAVAADAVTDLNAPPRDRTAYDRRALLNVIVVLLDAAQARTEALDVEALAQGVWTWRYGDRVWRDGGEDERDSTYIAEHIAAEYQRILAAKETP